MKILTTGFWMAVTASITSAAVFTTSSGSLNLSIPDANPGGVSSSLVISDHSNESIQFVRVNLDLNGGWAGDLYAHLTYTPSTPGGSTAYAVLLNRIGRDTLQPFGTGYNSLNVWLSDSGTDIHSYNGNSSSSWAPDGRTTDPLSVTSSDPRPTSFNNFNGNTVNGTWSLFFADLSSGSQTTLNSWSLELGTDLSAVPEPVNVALAIFGLGFAAHLGFQHWKRKHPRDPASP